MKNIIRYPLFLWSLTLASVGGACGGGSSAGSTSNASEADCRSTTPKGEPEGAFCCADWGGEACSAGLSCRTSDEHGPTTCAPPPGGCGVVEGTYTFTNGPDGSNTCKASSTITATAMVSCKGSDLEVCALGGECLLIEN